MAHLVEEYAKNLGVKIGKPVVSPHFFPIEFSKYIVISGESSTPSKCYKSYPIVFGFLYKFFKDEGINIVQVGGDKPIQGVNKHVISEFKNIAYLISKSMLYMGPDDYLSQYASSIGVKTLTLFGNSYASVTKPFWGSKKKSICLEPEWEVRPCYSDHDPLDNINKIKPEKVANSILSLLNNKSDLGIETLYIGKHYNQPIIEVVPTEIIEGLPKEIFLRADYGFEEEAFIYYCVNHKVTIVSEGLIQLHILKGFKDNVKRLMFALDADTDEIPQKYFDVLSSWNINLILLANKQEDLGLLRNKYFDVEVHPRYESVEKIECPDSAKFSTNKYILEADKKYLSYAHYKKGLDNDNSVLDTPEYWDELDHFYIYEQEESSKEGSEKGSAEEDIRT